MAATDVADARWLNSNFGDCVDLYAPGVAITSAMYTSPTATISATGALLDCCTTDQKLFMICKSLDFNFVQSS